MAMNKPSRKTRKPITLRRSMAILKKQMPELAERYRVKSLGVFGSYVRKEQTRKSDLDILVEFEQAPDLIKFIDLEEHLAKQLGVKVDLVPRRALKGEIGERILREVVAI
jgi:predicted nucleotidyltransferase